MLHPTFIASHPSGFSKLKRTSKDSLSEQYFYSNKNMVICEQARLLHIQWLAVGSLPFKSFSHPSGETESQITARNAADDTDL